MGAIKSNGYGDFSLRGRVVGAHRAAYELMVGKIPMGAQICHTCDVRCCVNPDHLFVGTRFDNMRDAAKKGRLGHHCAKLTFTEVESIRSSSARAADLAREFGVHVNTIHKARNGSSYKRRHALSHSR